MASSATKHAAIVLLRLAVGVGTIAVGAALAIVLWWMPWPIDVLIAVGSAAGWVSWLDNQEEA